MKSRQERMRVNRQNTAEIGLKSHNHKRFVLSRSRQLEKLLFQSNSRFGDVSIYV